MNSSLNTQKPLHAINGTGLNEAQISTGSAYTPVENVYTEISKIPEIYIAAIEARIFAQTSIKGRAGETFWTLAARHLGVRPLDLLHGPQIREEAVRLKALNPDIRRIEPEAILRTVDAKTCREYAVQYILGLDR